MATLFSKIAAGEIPSYKIAENEEFYAFLDIHPITKGHTLVIPKAETDYLFDIEDDVLGRMMVFTKKIAKALKKAIPCARVGVMVVGLEVPHAHIHLIPFEKESDLPSPKPKLKLEPDEMKGIAEKVQQNFNNK